MKALRSRGLRVLAGGVAGIVLLYWQSLAVPRENLDALVIPVSEQDLGAFSCLVEPEVSRRVVSITNTSQEAVAEFTLNASCECIAISPDRLRLSPRETGFVELQIVPSRPFPGDTALEWGFRSNLFATSTAESQQRGVRRWKLSGVARRSVVADPPVISFGGAREVVLGREANAELRLLSVTELAFVRAEVTPSSLGTVSVSWEGSQARLDYIHKAVETTGEFSGQLEILLTTLSEGALPPVTVPIVGRVTAPFRISPPETVLPSVAVGEVATSTVWVTSQDDLPFRVLAPEPLTEEIKLTLAPRMNERAPQQLDIQVRLQSPGMHRWEMPIRIQPTPVGSEVIARALVVRAYGIPGSLAAKPIGN